MEKTIYKQYIYLYSKRDWGEEIVLIHARSTQDYFARLFQALYYISYIISILYLLFYFMNLIGLRLIGSGGYTRVCPCYCPRFYFTFCISSALSPSILLGFTSTSRGIRPRIFMECSKSTWIDRETRTVFYRNNVRVSAMKLKID